MTINVTATWRLIRSLEPLLVKSDQGRALILSSGAAHKCRPFWGPYSASKAAVDQLTRSAALELAAKGVRVSAVNPGVVVTGLHRSGGLDAERYARFLTHSETTHPMGRVGQPEEVAEAILFLASAQAGWITGVTLPIDGGRHLTCAR
jgi:NAD(P)-dependent dehydrogenase (short-subunit alcohol dehydrogenase family)